MLRHGSHRIALAAKTLFILMDAIWFDSRSCVLGRMAKNMHCNAGGELERSGMNWRIDSVLVGNEIGGLHSCTYC